MLRAWWKLQLSSVVTNQSYGLFLVLDVFILKSMNQHQLGNQIPQNLFIKDSLPYNCF